MTFKTIRLLVGIINFAVLLIGFPIIALYESIESRSFNEWKYNIIEFYGYCFKELFK